MSELPIPRPKKFFRTQFKPKTCPFCHSKITPIIKIYKPHPMHGFRIYCPSCESFIGYGGRTKYYHFAVLECANTEEAA